MVTVVFLIGSFSENIELKAKPRTVKGSTASNQLLHHHISNAHGINADTRDKGVMLTTGQPTSWSETIRSPSCAAPEP